MVLRADRGTTRSIDFRRLTNPPCCARIKSMDQVEIYKWALSAVVNGDVQWSDWTDIYGWIGRVGTFEKEVDMARKTFEISQLKYSDGGSGWDIRTLRK